MTNVIVMDVRGNKDLKKIVLHRVGEKDDKVLPANVSKETANMVRAMFRRLRNA